MPESSSRTSPGDSEFRVGTGQARRLEIGPGPKPIPGFETLNIVPDGFSHYVADAAQKLPFADDTWDLIYASHVLEHIPWTHILDALREWNRVIKAGGWLEVWVPDGLKICRAFIDAEERGGPFEAPDGWYSYNPDRDPCTWANGRIFTYGDGQGTIGHPNWHMSIFSPRYLRKMLQRSGFSSVEPLDLSSVRGFNHGWINLGMRARK